MTGKVPHYAGGRFTDGTDWPDEICRQHGDDWGKAVTAAGYFESARLGVPSGLQVALYRHDGPRPRPPALPPYFVQVADFGTWEVVSAGTLPDAMDLVARWAPAATADILTSTWEAMFEPEDGRYGLLTSLLGTIRANETEGYVEGRAREIIRQRAEERRRHEERRRELKAAQGGAS